MYQKFSKHVQEFHRAGLPRCKNMWRIFFVLLARSGVWLLFNGLWALLFSLFYVIREFDKCLHQGWAHRALNEHYIKGGKHLYDPAEMETFFNKHAPGLFAQLYKSILNDDKEKLSKKRMEMQKTRVVSLLHNLSFFRNQVYVFIPRSLFLSYIRIYTYKKHQCFSRF